MNHENHIIIVKPVFSAVTTGTSGTVEPDWNSAPRKGDRLVDGTCVWENTGAERGECQTCGRVLDDEEFAVIRRHLRLVQ